MKLLAICIVFKDAENHLENCIDSFVDYLEDTIEVIFVDDGSKDSSSEIVGKYLENFKDMKLIKHTSNLGTSIARKTAVINSNSDYILFIDSDDKFIQNPISIFRKHYSDFDIIEFQAVDDKQNIIRSNFKDFYPETGNDYLEKFFRGDRIHQQLWLRFFKKNLFGEKTFPNEFQLNEDTFAFPVLLSKANKVIFLNEVLIQQSTHLSSTMGRHSANEKMTIGSHNIDFFLNHKRNIAENYLKILNHYEKYIPVSFKDVNYYYYLVKLVILFNQFNFNFDELYLKNLINKYSVNFKFPKYFFRFKPSFYFKNTKLKLSLYFIGYTQTIKLIQYKNQRKYLKLKRKFK